MTRYEVKDVVLSVTTLHSTVVLCRCGSKTLVFAQRARCAKGHFVRWPYVEREVAA